MLKEKKWLLPLLGFALAGTALAQSEPARFYKLDFVVKEVEGGKAVNSRTFSTMLAVAVPGRDNPATSIRTGGRVPAPQGPASTQFSYFDVGVNLDARDLKEAQGDVSLMIQAEINWATQEPAAPSPVTRQNRWSGMVLATVKKPTIVFASDDMISKRQLQLELTATPVK
jgi:hypothetical protein